MLTIYHNPRCSKSREALALVDGSGQEVVIKEYLNSSIQEGIGANPDKTRKTSPRDYLKR